MHKLTPNGSLQISIRKWDDNGHRTHSYTMVSDKFPVCSTYMTKDEYKDLLKYLVSYINKEEYKELSNYAGKRS